MTIFSSRQKWKFLVFLYHLSICLFPYNNSPGMFCKWENERKSPPLPFSALTGIKKTRCKGNVKRGRRGGNNHHDNNSCPFSQPYMEMRKKKATARFLYRTTNLFDFAPLPSIRKGTIIIIQVGNMMKRLFLVVFLWALWVSLFPTISLVPAHSLYSPVSVSFARISHFAPPKIDRDHIRFAQFP